MPCHLPAFRKQKVTTIEWCKICACVQQFYSTPTVNIAYIPLIISEGAFRGCQNRTSSGHHSGWQFSSHCNPKSLTTPTRMAYTVGTLILDHGFGSFGSERVSGTVNPVVVENHSLLSVISVECLLITASVIRWSPKTQKFACDVSTKTGLI